MNIVVILFMIMVVALLYVLFTYYDDNQYVKYVSDTTNSGINYISQQF